MNEVAKYFSKETIEVIMKNASKASEGINKSLPVNITLSLLFLAGLNIMSGVKYVKEEK